MVTLKMILATRNKGKVKEIKSILGPLDIEVLTLDDVPALELPPEVGNTFKENALAKAAFIAGSTGIPALADDSGLEVDYLDGRPGIYSARYAGQDATDRENYEKLLAELSGVEREKRTARFRCAIALVLPGREPLVFEGALEGFIATEPGGENGFGYDPVFFVAEEGKTAAELKPEEKNRISHRAKALEKLKDWLQKNL